MLKFEIHSTIQRFVDCLYRLKIWQNDEESAIKATKRKLSYLIFYIMFVIYNFTCVSFTLDDKNESFFLMVVGLMCSVTSVRLVYLLWNGDVISTFLYQPLSDHSIEFIKLTNQSSKTMKNFIQFVHLYVIAVFAAAISALLLTLPIFSTERMLPLFVPYTYEGPFSSIFYHIVNVCVTVDIFLSCLFNLTNVLNWYTMLNFSSAYEKLGERLSKLGRRNEKMPKETAHLAYLQDLITSIEVHKDILGYSFSI